jgi:hypothetical protein
MTYCRFGGKGHTINTFCYRAFLWNGSQRSKLGDGTGVIRRNHSVPGQSGRPSHQRMLTIREPGRSSCRRGTPGSATPRPARERRPTADDSNRERLRDARAFPPSWRSQRSASGISRNQTGLTNQTCLTYLTLLVHAHEAGHSIADSRQNNRRATGFQSGQRHPRVPDQPLVVRSRPRFAAPRRTARSNDRRNRETRSVVSLGVARDPIRPTARGG